MATAALVIESKAVPLAENLVTCRSGEHMVLASRRVPGGGQRGELGWQAAAGEGGEGAEPGVPRCAGLPPGQVAETA